MKLETYKRLAGATLGKVKADLLLKNCKIVDVFTGEIVESCVAVKDGIILGVSKSYQGKKEVDLKGAYIAPGFIDAHLHLESTMVAPAELVATAAACGTTTFIVDPHEACNVSGADGIKYILDQTEKSNANVFVMMPSCVPATNIDDNGCMFAANDMYPFVGNERILGLGEVMDALSSPGLEQYEGKTIAQIAREWGKSCFYTYLELAEMSGFKGRANMGPYSTPEIIEWQSKMDNVLYMTDAWVEENGIQNPAIYDCFPKFIHFSLLGKGDTMPNTIRKMTGKNPMVLPLVLETA